jgi:DNA-binding LacI/PurR family transcriptional regulator
MRRHKTRKNLRTGSQRATSADIARKLGISAMTVSRALNNHPNVKAETREQVARMAMKMGYVPDLIAKSLVLRKTLTIGVVGSEITHSFPDNSEELKKRYTPLVSSSFLHIRQKAEREGCLADA